MSGNLQFISVNPFSRWSYKEWGYDEWRNVIKWLWVEYGLSVVIVGAENERSKATMFLKGFEGCVFNLAGMTSLGELAGILSLSSLHVGVDSAAPHIAAAVDTPTITIYGPSDWYDWAPVGNNHKIVLPDLECVPCRNKGCNGKGESRCLEELTAVQVKKVIQESLEGILKSTIGSQKE
jgi:heptosyltransferase-3